MLVINFSVGMSVLQMGLEYEQVDIPIAHHGSTLALAFCAIRRCSFRVGRVPEPSRNEIDITTVLATQFNLGFWSPKWAWGGGFKTDH